MTKSHNFVHEMQQTAAIFGRTKELKIHFEGENAYTDGEQIVLPSIPHGVEFDQETTMVMRGYVDHEAGHCRHTDFAAARPFFETCSPDAKAIHNCLEDMWLERRVMDEYPGSEKNFRVLTQAIGVREKEFIDANQEVYSKFSIESVCNTILKTGRLGYGGVITKEIHKDIPEKLQAWGAKWIKEVHKCNNTSEVINLALQIEKYLDQTDKQADPDQPDQGKGLQGNPKDFTFDPKGDVTSGKEAKKAKEEGQQQQEKAQGDEPDLSKFVEDLIKERCDAYFRKHSDANLTKYRVLTDRYDEVYTRTSTNVTDNYRKGYLNNGTISDYDITKGSLGGVVNTMKARLRRALMAKETRDWDFGREMGKIDTKRLVAGSLGAVGVYKQRKDRMEVDTALHFLIDLSGSMSGDKSVVAMQSAIAFAECLEGTQIKYQISGFYTSGSNYTIRGLVQKSKDSNTTYHRIEPMNYFIFKNFAEPLTLAKGALSAISSCVGGCNADRDAVIWATSQLRTRPEKRKVLFVLSDGQPANSTLNVDSRKSYNVLGRALKEAIDECTKTGVECVGIGILTDHVEFLYPSSVSIENVKDLSGAVFTKLSSLLTGGKVVF